jgi:hypothetical protein
VVHLRRRQRLGPAQIAPRVGLAASTVHAILVRCGISRLAWLDRATGAPVRRYEHPTPGALVHVDVKKLGNIPAGGGHRLLGRATGGRNRQADRSSGQLSRHHNPLIGHGFIHAAVDDHSRLAYAELHADETGRTATGFLVRAQAWFAARGVRVQRVLTTTAPATAAMRGGGSASSSASRPNGPGRIGPRPTARSSGSTAPCWTAGPTGGCTPASRPAGPPSDPGCTGITTTGPTAHLAVVHQSPAAPTSPSLTASPGCAWSTRPSPVADDRQVNALSSRGATGGCLRHAPTGMAVGADLQSSGSATAPRSPIATTVVNGRAIVSA